MGNRHLTDIQLVDASQTDAGAYDWLYEQLEPTLATVADLAPQPRPRWREVRQRLTMARERRSMGLQILAASSCMLAVCALLVLSPLWGLSANYQLSISPAKATLPQVSRVGRETSAAASIVGTPMAMAQLEHSSASTWVATSTTAPMESQGDPVTMTMLPLIPTPPPEKQP